MANKPNRIKMLQQLLAANGVELNDSNQGIQVLNNWLRRNVDPDPADPGAPRRRWFSVMNDIALFLGDVMIKRIPGLEWRLFEKGQKNIAYHQPVIMGFDVPNPTYNVNLRLVLSTYVHRLLERDGDDDKDLFVRVLKSAEQLGGKVVRS